MKTKKIIWAIAIGMSFLSLMYVLRTTSTKTNPEKTIPQLYIREAYNLYISDPRIDISGDSRMYTVTSNSTDWVSMECKTSIGMFSLVTGNVFKGRIGFNPITLEGVWSGETPQNGRVQQGKVLLLDDSYGGFKIKFFYDDGNEPAIGTLTPFF